MVGEVQQQELEAAGSTVPMGQITGQGMNSSESWKWLVTLWPQAGNREQLTLISRSVFYLV